MFSCGAASRQCVVGVILCSNFPGPTFVTERQRPGIQKQQLSGNYAANANCFFFRSFLVPDANRFVLFGNHFS